MKTWLSDDQFRVVIRDTCLFALDLVVRDRNGDVLVGLRRRPPAQGTWFVPGGRVTKGETLTATMERVLKTEAGLSVDLADSVRLMGLYEHFFEDNVFGVPGLPTHYVIAACELRLKDKRPAVAPEHRWASPAQLLAAPDIHQYTKNYFLDQAPNAFP